MPLFEENLLTEQHIKKKLETLHYHTVKGWKPKGSISPGLG